MCLQLVTIISYKFTAASVINSSPLKPVKHNEESQKVNEAVGADEHSVEVWEMGRW